MNIGAHISIAKGYTKALQSAHAMGANTLQFFTRNPRGRSVKKIDEKDFQRYLELKVSLNFAPLVAHAPYIINLASPVDLTWNLGIEILIEDIERLDRMQVPYLCLHPGNHMGTGSAKGIKRISTALDKIFENTKSKDVLILLETMSGSGTEVGKNFEELKQIKDGCMFPERVAFCFDTCHVYVAGYDIRNNLEEVLDDFDKYLSLEKLKVFHLNDCLGSLGSKKDRHANIGEGMLGSEFFIKALKKKTFKDNILILETPEGEDKYPDEIRLIKKWGV